MKPFAVVFNGAKSGMRGKDGGGKSNQYAVQTYSEISAMNPSCTINVC
jgi:hypothetical protein